MKEMWNMKYRPKELDEYIFNNPETRAWIESCIERKDIPHLLLHGKQGTGKTALAYLLKDKLEIDDVDFLSKNASKDNSVSIFRNDISTFIATYALGDFKLVFLDEADRLSPEAFDCLKSMMEEYSNNARFILTCNRVHKIPSEIRSRLTEIKFDKIDRDEMTMRAAKILKAEKVKLPSLDLLDEFVKDAHNDFRRLLLKLQRHVVNGELVSLQTSDELFEIKGAAMLKMGEGDWEGARELLVDKLDDDDYAEMYRFMYDNLHELDRFSEKFKDKWKQGIVIISDYLYRHETVADKEINFTACLIKLSVI